MPVKPFQIDFILAPLAAGEYILELDAKSADEHGPADDWIQGGNVGACDPREATE